MQGALELKDLGFTRVVLARELSLPEVEHITRNCGIETECFVHGALCMCVSGQCYMSAFLGGRSGNRGSCAGPCRLSFEANPLPEGRPGRLHHLSLKDNSVIDKLDRLQAIGVASAKIEGRLRTPEYVAAAVNACLAGREGRAYDRDLLKNAFSRSGFTSGYLDGKIDGTMFGVRSEADAELTRKTLPALRELYRRERSRVPVKMKLEIEEGGEKLTVTDADGNRAFAYGDAEPQPARTDPTESLQRSLSKTGGTPFAVEKIDVEMDGGPWFVPGSAVNELRRTALEGLQQKRETLRPWPMHEVELAPLPQRTLPPHRTLRARFESWDQVPEQALSGLEALILPIAQADRVPRAWRSKTILELPRVMFGALEADTARRIAATQEAGFAGYEAGNIAHLRMCRGLPLSGPPRLRPECDQPAVGSVLCRPRPERHPHPAGGQGQRHCVHCPGAERPAGAHGRDHLRPHAADGHPRLPAAKYPRLCPLRQDRPADRPQGQKVPGALRHGGAYYL